MILADAAREKEYLKSLLNSLANHIAVLNVGELEVAKERLIEFNDRYQKYQQFSITVQRATSKAIITVNHTELSVAEAIITRGILTEKYNHLKHIQEYTINNSSEGTNPIDLDEIYKEMAKLSLDIKTLNSEIEYALWNVEVS